MLDTLLDRWRRTIQLDIGREQWVFRTNDSEMPFAPVLRINEDGRLIAAGEKAFDVPPPPYPKGRVVKLFEEERGRLSSAEAVEHQRALVAFCWYAIALTLRGSFVHLRPRLIVRNARALRRWGDGDGAALVAGALREGGAKTVEFID